MKDKKMKTNTFVVFLIMALLYASCSERKSISKLVDTGQTKEQIKEILGKPDEITDRKKTTAVIWGPEEGFWDKIPDGTALEVWHYKDSNGQLNLYFVEANDHLSYKAYIPNNVVYESDQQ